MTVKKAPLSSTKPPYWLKLETMQLWKKRMRVIFMKTLEWFPGYTLFLLLLEERFLCVVLAVLKSPCTPGWHQIQRFTYLCLLSARIKGVRHHLQTLQDIFLGKLNQGVNKNSGRWECNKMYKYLALHLVKTQEGWTETSELVMFWSRREKDKMKRKMQG